MKIYIEIKAAEGGNDAKLLVEDQKNIYQKYCYKNNLSIEVISSVSASCG